MRLLDVASVNPDGERWDQNYNATARQCNVQAELADACEEDTIPLVGDENSFGPGSYKVVPFPIQAFLRLPTTCESSDDEAWFKDAFRAFQERAVTRGLVAQPIAGAETWVGDANVQAVTLAATPSDAELEAAVFAAREQWYSTVFSVTASPILHVPPSMSARLKRIGILEGTPDGTKTITEDRLIIGNGYDVASPHIFWTGEIVVRLSSIGDSAGRVRRARLNDSTIALNQIAAIDVPPCSIVRVGS